MEPKYIELFRQLYSRLTTPQINDALRAAGLKHSDWMGFLAFMKGEKTQ